MSGAARVFVNRHKFQDDVWGEIRLNDLERDVIDTPEFQRLFRTSQMGFVDLVYQTANHTRGAHSIGACHVADELVRRVRQNLRNLDAEAQRSGLYADFEISRAERVLIRLGALLHDVSHVPFSHDLEKKTHEVICRDESRFKIQSRYGHYEKHDAYERNPLLYLLLFDQENSVLAQVLRRYSKPFWKLFQEIRRPDTRKHQDSPNEGSDPHKHLRVFIDLVGAKSGLEDWTPDEDLLPELLFHLLVFEKPDEDPDGVKLVVEGFNQPITKWHLGPASLPEEEVKRWHAAWYQPFRHDIIGNTLSADLIDYLTRDPQRLGNKRRIDLYLLNYYLLVKIPGPENVGKCRSAIDLYDHKRGTTHTFLLNDVFRLLDLRQEIHEKAVMHRVVQAANAMFSRALLLLREKGQLPRLQRIIGLPDPSDGNNEDGVQCHALQSEDVLLNLLLNRCEREQCPQAGKMIQKIIERRIYHALMIIPGDRARSLAATTDDGDPEKRLRTIAALVDSERYSQFLLFVSACLQKYLEGFFADPAELFSYVEECIGNAGTLRRVLQIIPTRFLFWTLPYKQLYKDPKVVVALEDCVGPIDAICETDRTRLQKSTKERIESALRDADSKYATLWRLYVLVSDGLFYSGIISKAFKHLERSGIEIPRRNSHTERIRFAETFVAVALTKLCEDWKGRAAKIEALTGRNNEQQAERLKPLLERRMGPRRLKWLIKTWAHTAKDAVDPAASVGDRLSTVDASEYAHEFTAGVDISDSKAARCRDVRYKFDVLPNGETSMDDKVRDFLRACRLDAPGLFSRSEVEQMSALLRNPEINRRCELLSAEAVLNTKLLPQAFRALWTGDFPSPNDDVIVEDLNDAARIRKRLDKMGEAIRSKKAAFARWSRANDRIAAFIIARPSERRADILDDLHLRITNESHLFWNNFKEDAILRRLNRQWSQ
jgi:HD superfamily phosphohydrolase